MRKYIIIATILLLAAACNKAPVSPDGSNGGSVPVPLTSKPSGSAGWQTYTNSQFGFSVQYPEGFGFTTDREKVLGLSYIPVCDEKMAACFYIIRQTFAATNFDGAGVSVNMLNTNTRSSMTDYNCYDFTTSISSAKNKGPDVTINGIVFKTATGGDAAAGHSQKLKVYRNFHNGFCYELSVHVGSTNIDNYPKGTVQQLDENEIWQQLQGVVNTFKFTNSSLQSSYQSYVSNAYKFKLQYPTGWSYKDAGTVIVFCSPSFKTCGPVDEGVAGDVYIRIENKSKKLSMSSFFESRGFKTTDFTQTEVDGHNALHFKPEGLNNAGSVAIDGGAYVIEVNGQTSEDILNTLVDSFRFIP